MKLDKVWNLSILMLGKSHRPTLNAKAKECHGLLEFAVLMLEKFKSKIPRNSDIKTDWINLIEAGKAAMQFDSVLKNGGQILSDAERLQLFVSYQRFASLFTKADGEVIPKFHLMYHLIFRSKYSGNPIFHQTYYHEHVNGKIAKVARSCHRSTWGTSVHKKIHLGQALESM